MRSETSMRGHLVPELPRETGVSGRDCGGVRSRAPVELARRRRAGRRGVRRRDRLGAARARGAGRGDLLAGVGARRDAAGPRLTPTVGRPGAGGRGRVLRGQRDRRPSDRPGGALRARQRGRGVRRGRRPDQRWPSSAPAPGAAGLRPAAGSRVRSVVWSSPAGVAHQHHGPRRGSGPACRPGPRSPPTPQRSWCWCRWRSPARPSGPATASSWRSSWACSPR